MTGEPEIHVDLTLRPEARTVTGEIRSDDGANEAYTGWIGLLAVLQNLAGGHAGTNEGRE